MLKRARSKIQNHPQAALILLVFFVLAIIYSLVTPPFEAGDESRHYAVVKYMADTGRLPVQEPGEAQIHWSHEGNQPPLYYALAAALTFWINTGDWNDVYWYNPHTTIGNPLRPDNKNITIQPPGSEWPWRGHVLAVHLIRFLSIVMATVTVATGYALALTLFQGNRWLAAGAMAITAFNPMFIFISSSVNNDNAVIMFVTLALWLMVRMSAEMRRQGDESQTTDSLNHSQFIIHNSQFIIILLGLLIGLGALSKLYALGLLPLAGLLFLWLAYQDDRRPPTAECEASLWDHRPPDNDSVTRNTLHTSRIISRALIWTAITFLVVLVVAGWFYARNAVVYNGDLLALQVMRETAGQRQESPTLATLRAEFQGFRIAYWALFGGVNILADNWIYQVLDWVSLMAAIGVIAFILRFTIYDLRFTPHASPIFLPTLFLLLGWWGIMVSGFIAWNLTQPAGQGRLLYPAITAISALGMLGLTWWLPTQVQKFVAVLSAFGLLIFAALAPVLYIAPAYTKTPLLTEADLPADLQPINYTYDGKIRLLGYQLQAGTVHPAESLPLTLYWQIVEPTGLDYSIFVHLLGRQRQVVGQIDTYPGGGHWPTTLLSPGDILADLYEVPILPEAEFTQAPTRLLIAAGIYDFHEPGRPGKPARNAAGETVEPIIASAKLIPWQWPSPPRFDPPINFSNQITLLSYDITPDQQAVRLNWQADAALDTDYTVFLQVWPASDPRKGEYIIAFDGPPVQGDYPTSLWEPGEIIVDTHVINLTSLPAGDYYLLAGLYNPATLERLPASAAGQPLPDYAVKLGTLQVAGSRK